MKIAVTGASGFIGSTVSRRLEADGIQVVRLSRSALIERSSYADCDAAIHCAGLAHVRGSVAEHESSNHAMTVAFASAAKQSGVKRLVFVSTINVVAGNVSLLTPDMPIAPLSPYGEAKAKAERDLREGIAPDCVIIRPPLVCGAGAKGNFRLLMRLCNTPLPLPFGAARNRRSFIGVNSLASAIVLLATTEGVEGQTFHAVDGEMSTRDIVNIARHVMGRAPRNVAIPPAIITGALRLMGRSAMGSQLFGDLLVDGSKLQSTGWFPSPLEPEMAAMARLRNSQR